MNEELEKLQSEIAKAKGTSVLAEECGDVRRVYNYCVHLIARQDYSEHKLRQKLRSKRQNLPHVINEAIEKIKAKGLIKEESYRRLFIRKWMMKGEAEDKIRKRGAMEKLQFEDHEFEDCERELGFSDTDSVEKLVLKKLRSKDIPKDPKEKFKLRDKVMRFLVSKGHSFDEAKRALAPHFKTHSSYED